MRTMERLINATAQPSEPARPWRRLHIAELQAIEAIAVAGDAMIVALATIHYDWPAGAFAVGACIVRVALLKRAHAQVRADIRDNARREGYRAGRLAGIFEEAEVLRSMLPPRPAPPSPTPDSDARASG